MDNYYSALDRGLYEPRLDPNALYHRVSSNDTANQPDDRFSPSQIGTTAVLAGNTTDPVRLVQSELKKGVGHLEISANQVGSGRGQGNKGFEEVDREERQILRDIQKAVKGIDITTHATPAISGGTGFDPQSRTFSEDNRKRQMDELKKAIDFASEATFGGSVVMHTGEFRRPMYNLPGDDYKGKFQTHAFEHEEAAYELVDPRDEKLIGGITEDYEIWVPVQAKDPQTGKLKWLEELDPASGVKRPLIDDITEKKIPVYEILPEGEIKFEKVGFKDFVRKQFQDPEKKSMIEAYAKKVNNGILPKGFNEEHVLAKEAASKEFYKEMSSAQISQHLGQSRQYFDNYKEGLRRREKILNQLQFYKKLKEEYGEDWKQFEQTIPSPRDGPYLPGDITDPVKYLQDQLKDNEREIGYGREQTLSGIKQAKELLDRIDNTQTRREFSLNRSYHTYAELGIYAMEKTNAMKQSMTSKDDKERVRPIAITLENLYPEEYGYGSTADEIIDIVTNSRKRMADLLVKQKIEDPRGKTYSEDEAKELQKKGMNVKAGQVKIIDNPYFRKNITPKDAQKIAADHIQMTFDTGHFNMWRKYFKRNVGESEESFDKRFKDWYGKEVDKLAKAGIVGNVHLADNFGYDDNHLAPGQGNAPVKESLEKLKTKDFKGSIAVEGGWGQGKDFTAGWKLFHSPIFAKKRSETWTSPGGMATGGVPMYSAMTQGPDWNQIQDGYLGRMHKPYFIFGGYNTGQPDDNKPWSNTSME